MISDTVTACETAYMTDARNLKDIDLAVAMVQEGLRRRIARVHDGGFIRTGVGC